MKIGNYHLATIIGLVDRSRSLQDMKANKETGYWWLHSICNTLTRYKGGGDSSGEPRQMPTWPVIKVNMSSGRTGQQTIIMVMVVFNCVAWIWSLGNSTDPHGGSLTYHKIPDWIAYKHRNFSVLEVEKFMIQGVAGSVFDKGWFPIGSHFHTVSTHGRRGKGSLWGLSYKGIDHIDEGPAPRTQSST